MVYEHWLGLKSAPGLGAEGRAPRGLGRHRFEWLYLTAFLALSIGETVW